jgi:hypothetical protein
MKINRQLFFFRLLATALLVLSASKVVFGSYEHGKTIKSNDGHRNQQG